MASSISTGPIPVKVARSNTPYWQINDRANAKSSGVRRFAAMSVGFSSDYRNITDKKYAYVNENVRKDYDAKLVITLDS